MAGRRKWRVFNVMGNLKRVLTGDRAGATLFTRQVASDPGGASREACGAGFQAESLTVEMTPDRIWKSRWRQHQTRAGVMGPGGGTLVETARTFP